MNDERDLRAPAPDDGCAEARDRLSELPAWEREHGGLLAAWRHAEGCAACAAERDGLTATLAALAPLAPEPGPGFEDAVMARILRGERRGRRRGRLAAAAALLAALGAGALLGRASGPQPTAPSDEGARIVRTAPPNERPALPARSDAPAVLVASGGEVVRLSPLAVRDLQLGVFASEAARVLREPPTGGGDRLSVEGRRLRAGRLAVEAAQLATLYAAPEETQVRAVLDAGALALAARARTDEEDTATAVVVAERLESLRVRLAVPAPGAGMSVEMRDEETEESI